MPQSLSIGSAQQTSNKRHRSRESRTASSRSTSQQGHRRSLVAETEKLAQRGVRVPSYLKKTKSEIQAAFYDLEWKQRYRLAGAVNNPGSPFHIDRSPATVLRNRYAGIQPWDNSRIKLKTPINGSDYVNASPIKLHPSPASGRQRGRRNTAPVDFSSEVDDETRYIATQGPKDGQFSYFWHMVMQETPGDVGVIIMLTTCYEGLKEKCAQYFPLDMTDPTVDLPPEPQHEVNNESGKDDGDPFLDSDVYGSGADKFGTEPTTAEPALTDGDGEAKNDTNGAGGHDVDPRPTLAQEQTEAGFVQLLSLEKDDDVHCEVRQLKLVIGEQTKMVHHYLFDSWPDFGKPEAQDRVALIQLMKTSRKVAGKSPRIVHCSAGVGRTGTWITLDHLLRELDEGRLSPQQRTDAEQNKAQGQETWGRSGPAKATTPEAKASDIVHDTVDNLRIQRMMMVMNELQYSFIYEVLREAFIAKYTEEEIGTVVTAAADEVGQVLAKLDASGEERSPKVARTSGKTQDEVGGESEAETELGGEDDEEVSAEAQKEEGMQA